MQDLTRVPRRFHALALAVGLGAAVAATWPAALHLRDHLVDGGRFVQPEGAHDWIGWNMAADVLTSTWVVAWDLHGLATQPTRLFDANVYYPAPLALARQEHMVATALLGAPGYVLDGPVLAHQTALLVCFVVDVWAAAWVVLRWSGSAVGGLAAGLLFALSGFNLGERMHLQSLGTPYVPILLLAFDRLGATGRGRWAVLAGLALALQILSGQYLGYFAIVVAVLGAVLALPIGAERPGFVLPAIRNAGWLLLSALLAAGLVLPFSLPYMRLASTQDLPDNSTTIYSVFGVRPQTWLPGPHGDGLIPTAVWLLCLAGTVALVRGGGRQRLRLLVLLALGVVGASLAGGLARDFLGLTRILNDYVPGFRTTRGAGRWTFVPYFAAAMLGGLGAGALAQRLGRMGVLVTAALLAAVFVPALRRPLPLRLMPVGADLPAEYSFLARCGAGDPLLELPVPSQMDEWRDAWPAFFSTFHWLPLVNGRGSYPPKTYEQARALSARLPSSEALAALRDLTGVRWLLVHCDRAPLALCNGLVTLASRTRSFGWVRLYDLGPVPTLPRPGTRRWEPAADCAG